MYKTGYYKFALLPLLLLAITLWVSFYHKANAWPKDYEMTVFVTTDKNDNLTEVFLLTEREVRALKEAPRANIKPYLIKIRRKYADDIGYRHEIYGKNNYKMVVIDSYSFEIRDRSTGMLVFSSK